LNEAEHNAYVLLEERSRHQSDRKFSGNFEKDCRVNRVTGMRAEGMILGFFVRGMNSP
jgi:hypothetical protein